MSTIPYPRGPRSASYADSRTLPRTRPDRPASSPPLAATRARTRARASSRSPSAAQDTARVRRRPTSDGCARADAVPPAERGPRALQRARSSPRLAWRTVPVVLGPARRTRTARGVRARRSPVNGTTIGPAFDHARLARALAGTRRGKAAADPHHPPPRRPSGLVSGDDGATVTFGRRSNRTSGRATGAALAKQEPGRLAGRRRPRLARRPPRPLPRRRQPLPPRARDRRRPAPYHKRDRGLLLRKDRGRLGRAGDGRTRERHGDAVCGLVARLAASPHVPGRPAERNAPRPPPLLARERHRSGRSPTPTATRCPARTWRSTSRS